MNSAILRGLVLLVGCCLLNGCATISVWQGMNVTKEPALPTRLEVYHSETKHDFLIAYDEFRGTAHEPRRRAYWLRENATNISHNHKPHFVPINQASSLSAVPVFETFANARSATNAHFVLLGPNGYTFKLCDEPGASDVFGEIKDEIKSNELPSYVSSAGRALQIALTPVAVAADVSIVGVAAAAVLGPPSKPSGLHAGP